MTRRKNAHCCENCAYFYNNGSRCECEQENELTEKQYTKYFENCEAGCPLFSKKPEYSREDALQDLLALRAFYIEQTGGCCPMCLDYAINNL